MTLNERSPDTGPVITDQSLFISFGKVAKLTSLSRGTIYNMVSRGDLPPPVRLTTNRVAFRTTDINGWLASRMLQDA